ncbi:DUF456 domain-containing protein [Brasilonema sp. UFV-L1]|uniref:DUF456 domain-containing protein n=1 Tax=Brasilonema sp. UFV-L1 TaxID=2234130 RepID=UPI00145C59AE|nr:DUF456 domain-containing protein [Brasilonema sp. UFV-L1]NMG08719.1 hypothetical protein [Brasilonema sp. UFV-L1]
MSSVNTDMQIMCILSAKNMQSLLVASISQTTQSSQSHINRQADENISFLVGFFLIFVFIGFFLGCLIQYRKYKHKRAKKTAEILQEIETLKKTRERKYEDDEMIHSQRKKQIEILEKIWKMKP